MDKPQSNDAHNSRVTTDEKPFQSFFDAIVWFVLPAVVLGLFLRYVIEAKFYVDADTERFLSSWLIDHSVFAIVVQGLLVVSTVHAFTTIAGKRLIGLAFSFVITGACLSLHLLLLKQFGYSSGEELSNFDWVWVTGTAVIGSLIIVFISIPFFRTIVHRRQSFNHYSSLFEYAWNQSVVFVLAWLFVGVVYSILGAAVLLFYTVDFDLAKIVFDKRYALVLISSSFAVGIAISRQFGTLIHSLVELIASLFRIILVLHLFFVLIFLAFIAIQGFESFDDVIEVKVIILTTVAIALTLITSGVGYIEAPTSRWLNITWRAMSISSLLLSCLGIWLVTVRITNYGVTHEYLLLTIAMLIGLFYSLGYFLSALIPKVGRSGVQQTNVFGAIFIFIIAVFLQTPTGDLVRYSVDSQVQRIQSEGGPVEQWKLRWLARDAGFRGQIALDTLYANTQIELPDRNSLSIYSDRTYRRKNANQTENAYIKAQIDSALEAGTLKVSTVNAEPSTDSIDRLYNERSLNYRFQDHCLTKASSCRIIFTTEFDPDVMHAMVLIRASSVLAYINWYKKDALDQWTTMRSINNVVRAEPHELDDAIDSIDKGEFRVAPTVVNAVTIGNQSFYPIEQ